MKKQDTGKKRLQLNRETVRQLSAPELAHAAGGTVLSQAACGFSVLCYTNTCLSHYCNPPIEN